jgi:hypothetical protein
MKDAVKKIYDESMEWIPNNADPKNQARVINVQKMIEITVRECIRFNEEHYRSSVAADAIKKHFEIE